MNLRSVTSSSQHTINDLIRANRKYYTFYIATQKLTSVHFHFTTTTVHSAVVEIRVFWKRTSRREFLKITISTMYIGSN